MSAVDFHTSSARLTCPAADRFICAFPMLW